MENIITTFGSKLPFTLVCFIVMFTFVSSGNKMNDRMKIGVLSILCYILFLIGLDILIGLICYIAVSFCCLELFSNDTKKNEMLNLKEKMADYLFSMFFECSGLLFLFIIFLTIVVNNYIQNCDGDCRLLWMSDESSIAWNFAIVISIIFLFFLQTIAAPKFLRKTYSQIVELLGKEAIYQSYSKGIDDKFNMLSRMEDRMFFDRNETQHTIFSFSTMVLYFKEVGFCGLMRRVKMFFMIDRGYATIDVQLLRSIGIEKGYDCLIRRKVFELLCSNMIYNSFVRRYNVNKYCVKNWILINYVRSVMIKINDRIYYPEGGDTFKRAFNKKFEDTSMEGFFVWCLGLECFERIGDNVVDSRKDIILEFKLNRKKIMGVLDNFNNK